MQYPQCKSRQIVSVQSGRGSRDLRKLPVEQTVVLLSNSQRRYLGLLSLKWGCMKIAHTHRRSTWGWGFSCTALLTRLNKPYEAQTMNICIKIFPFPECAYPLYLILAIYMAPKHRKHGPFTCPHGKDGKLQAAVMHGTHACIPPSSTITACSIQCTFPPRICPVTRSSTG